MNYTEVGKTFVFEDKTFIVVEDKPWPNCSCDGCCFNDDKNNLYNISCDDVNQMCTHHTRPDDKQVVFKLVQNEPKQHIQKPEIIEWARDLAGDDNDFDRCTETSVLYDKTISNYRMLLSHIKEHENDKYDCSCEHDCCGHICSVTMKIERSESYVFIVKRTLYNY